MKKDKKEKVNPEETLEKEVTEETAEAEAEPVSGEVTDEPKEPTESEKVAELTDRLQRLMAEFDNYRKRTEKEKEARYDMGIMKAVEKLLPVVDSFERGIAQAPEGERENPVFTGMELIYNQLSKMLTDLGVQPIAPEGKEFDPNLHNAVMQVENEDFPENTVVAELQKGYTYKGNVVRHSMVSVNK